MEEFKEGNMLFEAMQRKVWSKASTDSKGLKKYYDEHKENINGMPVQMLFCFHVPMKLLPKMQLTANKKGRNGRML